ncbi:hypothetical protein Plhal710r2_c065g0174211 [Plasmopara halstedii]
MPYRSIMYLMVVTCPDLSAAKGDLHHFAADPCPAHWQALVCTAVFKSSTD